MTYFDDTDELTLALDENMSGANGELAEDAVRDRLIESIRKATAVHESDFIPIGDVADLLLRMFRQMLSDQTHLVAMLNGWEPPALEERSDLRRAIGLKVKGIAARVMLLKEAEA